MWFQVLPIWEAVYLIIVRLIILSIAFPSFNRRSQHKFFSSFFYQIIFYWICSPWCFPWMTNKGLLVFFEWRIKTSCYRWIHRLCRISEEQYFSVWSSSLLTSTFVSQRVFISPYLFISVFSATFADAKEETIVWKATLCLERHFNLHEITLQTTYKRITFETALHCFYFWIVWK